MNFLALIILISVHLFPWLFLRGKPWTRSPAKLITVISAIQTIPHFAIIMYDPSRSLLHRLWSDNDIVAMLPEFGLYYSIGMVCLYFGLIFGNSAAKYIKLPNLSEKPIRHPGVIIAILFAVYLTFLALIFNSAGGLGFFLSNIASRASLLAGTGIYVVIASPVSYLITFFAIFSYVRNGWSNLWVIFLIIITVAILESLLGGRRQPLQLVIFSILALSMLSSNFKLLSFRSALLGVLAVAIFVVLLLVRVGEGGGGFDILDIAANLSHNDSYIFVLNHFQTHDFWFGAAFLDIVHRIIPLYDLPSNPPVDEGVYVYNLFLGNAVSPPTPFAEMAWNSWPPDTFGNGYLNFGFFGVVAFFFIRGMVVAISYRVLCMSGHSPVFLLIYLWLAFGFHVSNLKITQFLMLIVGLAALVPIVSYVNRLRVSRT